MQKRNPILNRTIVLLLCLLLGPVASADTLLHAPSACSGQWSGCPGAFSDGGTAATGLKDTSALFGGYGFSLSTGDRVDRVVLRADFSASGTNGYADIQVSGDGGATYGPPHRVGGNTGEQTYLMDVTGDLAWSPGSLAGPGVAGNTWTPESLSDSRLRVKATCVKVGPGKPSTCRLDYLPVEVTFTPPPPPPCTRSNPMVSVSPPAQNGTSGLTLAYRVTVTNQDSGDCNASLFMLTSTVPAGWNGYFPQDLLAISPASSGSTDLLLTPPGNTTLGDYGFIVTAANLNATLYSGTANATYHVF
ncbi:MAG: hypothetical protein HY558_05255 [Euryarchaeota archaeon]|nr:hypothetical protein [Euryarchaeota archaeon]